VDGPSLSMKNFNIKKYTNLVLSLKAQHLKKNVNKLNTNCLKRVKKRAGDAMI